MPPKAKVRARAKAPVQVKEEEKVDKSWVAAALQHELEKEQLHQHCVQQQQELHRLQQVVQLQQQQQQQEAYRQQQQQYQQYQQQLQQQQQYEQLQQQQYEQLLRQQQHQPVPASTAAPTAAAPTTADDHTGQNWVDVDPNGRQVPPFWNHGADTWYMLTVYSLYHCITNLFSKGPALRCFKIKLFLSYKEFS